MSRASDINYWPDDACARAFWSQHELPTYQQLLRDTVAWLDPQPRERWLDLGCGRGMLAGALWRKGGGQLAEVVGLDCAAINARAWEKLRSSFDPPVDEERFRFVVADFSTGLGFLPAGSFDGIVSGLAIQYAESYARELGEWTTDAYDRILREAHRLLRPGGSFVFSVNVPNPSWAWVAFHSFWGAFSARNPLRYFRKTSRMLRYGGWLKREAARGRFHYLPREIVYARLADAGFASISSRTSFAGQAYLFRCHKAAALPLAA